MSSFEIPDAVINATASQIHAKTNKDYQIPVVGVPENLETPQVFEIMPFTEIDKQESRFYAIDGSRNSHTFYNGVSLCFYQAGYVCFHKGKQIRLNVTDDPVVMGKVFHGEKMLVLAEKDLSDVYDEFLTLSPVAALLAFWGDKPEEIFPYKKELVIANAGTLLGFCQEVLEWACIYDIVQTTETASILNRLRFDSVDVFQPVGFTEGYGHFHLANGTFAKIRAYLTTCKDKEALRYKFGNGPNYRIRVVRRALERLNLPPELLRHGVKRGVYVAPLARNTAAFLNGRASRLRWYERPLTDIVAFWRERWLLPRSERDTSYRAFEAKSWRRILELDDF